MMRWFNPVLFAGAAIYVRWYNAGHGSSQLLFPGLQHFTEGDFFKAGALTWQLLAGFAVLLAIWAGFRELRSRRARGEAETDDQ